MRSNWIRVDALDLSAAVIARRRVKSIVFPTLAVLVGAAGAAQGSIFYGVTGSGLVQIDTSAQSVTSLGTLHAGATNLSVMADCDFNGSGNLIGLRQGSDFGGFPPAPLNQAYQINTTNASVVQLSNFSTTYILNAAAYSTTLGQMLSVDSQTGKLGTINFAASTFTPLYAVKHGLPGANKMDGLAFAPDGTLYGVWDGGVAFGGTFDYKLVRYDLTTGLATQIGSIGTPNVDRFMSLRFDEVGNAYTVNTVTGAMETINLTTGVGTTVFTSSALIGTTGLALQIPAPASAALLGIGGFIAARRRR